METALRCEEKLSLIVAYQKATASYSAVVSHMVLMGLSEEQFAQLQEAAENARKHSVAARDVLDQHIKEHGC